MLLQQVLEELSPITSPQAAVEEEEEEEEQDKSESPIRPSPNPVRTLHVKRSAPGSTNAHYLHRAAIAAKEIQSASHGRLSAPALLANCLLSVISLSDDDDDDELADKIEDDPAPAVEEGRNTILKSFSQLHAEDRNRKEALINHSLQGSNHKKLEIISCCLFPCKRNISSKSMGSTLELLQSSDELSSSNDDGNSRSRVRVVGGGGGGAWTPCNLRSFMNRVLCKGSSEAGAGSSIGDHEMIYDDDQQGLSVWAGTPISNQSHVDQEDDHNVDHEYMYNNGHSLLRVGNTGGYGTGVFAKAGRSAGAMAYSNISDGGAEAVAQEVVHEASISPSHDAPVASSFVFEQSCFSSSSSTSSTSHCIKLESVHPWLISATDLDSCNTSPLHHVHSDANPNDPPPNHALMVMQDDFQFRLANKRHNLSR